VDALQPERRPGVPPALHRDDLAQVAGVDEPHTAQVEHGRLVADVATPGIEPVPQRLDGCEVELADERQHRATALDVLRGFDGRRGRSSGPPPASAEAARRSQEPEGGLTTGVTFHPTG